ncbi:quinon protein alcohol dehydrogenase-like superfamily [Gongronella butleri]|nr:quinon protein alcohol dehydrogenase-like superfamily [Gongronella butleri]
MFKRDEKKGYHEEEDADSLELNGRPFEINDVMVCTTHGKVYAISKTDGSRYWRQKFPGGGFGGIVSTFITDNGKVILGCNGKTACLDLFTGETKWVNKMKGMGLEEVAVVTSISQYMPARVSGTEAHSGSELPPSYEGSTTDERQIVYGCARGKVLAIDPETGEDLWRYDCPGGGYNIPSILLEPKQQGSSRWSFGVVYIGCGRWVYCLRATTGEVLWTNRISNSKFGYGYLCFSTPMSSRLRAELYTDFSSFPFAQAADAERQRRSNNGG